MIEDCLAKLHALDEGRGIAHVEQIAAQPARYGQLSPPLPAVLQQFLDDRGIQLYRHQVAAIEHVRAGRNVVLATPTASGKTLAFNLPVFARLERDPQATALYLYPTKALANDQLRSLQQLQAATGLDLGAAVYDGDTPAQAKRRIRGRSRVVLSNPHALHHYLPNHRLWKRFLANLAVVVIDEAHWYRGVLGSNVALLFRRLRRITERYGSSPTVVLASGTIANPGEHASRLVGEQCEVVADSGAARGPKTFVVWNPVPTGERSPHVEAAHLLAFLVNEGHQTICFTVSRRMAELTAMWARERAPDHEIVAYRAGYQADDRRQIEHGLKTGSVRGVAATNALELGIDIGSLDAVVMAGYPGTLMSLWQQAGRAGRGTQPALTILVAFDDPLDQYLASHPRTLFDNPVEHAVVDLANEHILAGHALCAAREFPVHADDQRFFGPGLVDALGQWRPEGILVDTPHGQVCRTTVWAPDRVPLTAIDDGAVEVRCDGLVLETLSRRRALLSAHPGAVLLHQGETYLIEDLDLDRGKALARRAPTDVYTQALDVPTVDVIEELANRPLPSGTLSLGTVRVTDTVVGYTRKRYDQVIDEWPLDLPQIAYRTAAIWCTPSDRVREAVRRARGDWLAGLHAAEHAMIHMLPLFAMCDARDVGGLSTARHSQTHGPVIFIYDGFPGGVGIAEKSFTLIEQLVQVTHDMIRDCPCRDGCPSCVYDRQCGNANQLLDKRAALTILARLVQPPRGCNATGGT
ncbi:MAG: DEAD/DEAH box helicase [Egibacteraceae bacterium]